MKLGSDDVMPSQVAPTCLYPKFVVVCADAMLNQVAYID